MNEAVSCDICAKWQHRLCYTGIKEDIYNAANRDQAEFEFVFYPCQHDLRPRQDTEFIIEDFPGQFPNIDIPDKAVSFQLVCTISNIYIIYILYININKLPFTGVN